MSKTLIGNIKGPKGDTGETGATGDKGETGATGQRGSRWSEGTAIIGTSTTAAVFSGTGITDALVNDYYLNTSTGNVYRCTVSGDASTAKWVYVANIKGKAGKTPTDGTNMTAAFVQASARDNIATGETHGTIFGRIKKWFADLTAAAFAQMISSYSDLMSNTVSGYLLDALAVKEGFEAIDDNLYNSFTTVPITNEKLNGVLLPNKPTNGLGYQIFIPYPPIARAKEYSIGQTVIQGISVLSSKWTDMTASHTYNGIIISFNYPTDLSAYYGYSVDVGVTVTYYHDIV